MRVEPVGAGGELELHDAAEPETSVGFEGETGEGRVVLAAAGLGGDGEAATGFSSVECGLHSDEDGAALIASAHMQLFHPWGLLPPQEGLADEAATRSRQGTCEQMSIWFPLIDSTTVTRKRGVVERRCAKRC